MGDIKGESAVYRAVKENKIEALKLLLSHPNLTALTLNMKSKEGAAPVLLAVRPDRYESLLLLVDDPRVDLDTDFEGQSLEEIARENRTPEVLKVVVEAKQRRE